MYELFDTIKLSYNGSNHTLRLRRSTLVCYCWSCLLWVSSDLSAFVQSGVSYLPVIVLRTWFMPHSEIELLFSKRIAPFQIHCAVITRSMEAKFLIESNGLFSSMIYAGEEVQALWPEDGNKQATADSSDKLLNTCRVKNKGWHQWATLQYFIAEHHISDAKLRKATLSWQKSLCSLQTERDNFHLMMVAIWLFTEPWWQLPSGPATPAGVIECRLCNPALPRQPGEPSPSAGCFSF